MKKKYLLLLFSLAFILVLSACAMGPRAVGTPGLTADGDMVYTAYQSAVYAVDVTNGIGSVQTWKFPQTANAKVVLYANPEISGDFIYLGDLANVFHKLNKDNGSEIWSFTEAKGWFVGQAKAAGDLVLAPSADRSLYAINSNGTVEWVYKHDHTLWAQPVVDADLVFIGTLDHKVLAVKLSTGELKWEALLGGAIVSAPAYDTDLNRLYVGTLGREVVALNAETGKEVWKFPETDSISSIWSTPLIHDGQVIAVDETGHIFSLDAATGSSNWTGEAGGNVMAGLLPLEESFLVALESGEVRGIAYDGKRTNYFFQVNGQIYTTPVNANNVIVVAVVGNEDKALLFGYDLEGKQVFSFTPSK